MRTAFGRHCGYVNIRPLNREDSVLYFPPEAFGPFRVLHQIGTGALGPVFRAVEPGRERLIAIKVFRLDLTPEQSVALVNALEHVIAKRLQHPSIVAPIAAGLESGAAFLAQEYAVGDSLDVVLRERGPLPRADVVKIVGSLADAIDRAAAAGVMHGSLHPRDVIVSGDGARITGFGVAETLTSIGLTLPNRSPYSGFDGATDVHALAAIAFEAMSGRRLSEENLDELEHEQGRAIRDVFSAALARDPRARPRRAADFASALRDASERVDRVDLVEPEPVDRFVDVEPVDNLRIDEFVPEHEPQLFQAATAEHERKERRPLVPILLISALAVALIAGYFLIRPRTPARPAETPPAAATKPSVAETTVDLPEKPQPPPVAPTPQPAAPSPAPIRLGSLLIRSSPANADVTVNGKPSGQTPITMRNLPLGSYTIRVVREGYVAEQQRVQLTAERATAATTFSLRPAPVRSTSGVGSINVRSRPAGARVFVNERLMGSTPLAIPGIPAGSATVRIEMDGYRPWTTTVQVNAGEPTPVNASLDTR